MQIARYGNELFEIFEACHSDIYYIPYNSEKFFLNTTLHVSNKNIKTFNCSEKIISVLQLMKKKLIN